MHVKYQSLYIPAGQVAAGQQAWAAEDCACLLCTCNWLDGPVLIQTLWVPFDAPGCLLHQLVAGLGQQMYTQT